MAKVAPFGISEATLVPVVRLEVAPVVLVRGDGRAEIAASRRLQGGRGQIDDAGAGAAGEIGHAVAQVVAAVEEPLHAEIRALVDRDFDDQRLDLDLRAADIEFVDDRHQVLHDLRRRRHDERIGGHIRPNGHAGIDVGAAGAAPAGAPAERWAGLRFGGWPRPGP